MKLPVFGTIRNGAILATRIGRQHSGALIGFAIVYAVIYAASDISRDPAGEPSRLVSVVQSILGIACSMVIAVLAHREILVGSTSFQSLLSRPGMRRLGGYLIDSLAVGAALVAPLVLALIFIVTVTPPWTGNHFLFDSSLILLGLASALVSARLALKLPARAIDEPLEWRQVWALGRGNTLRLLVVIFVASGFLSWLAGLITGAIAHASPILAHLVDGTFSTGMAVLVTAWLAVSYLYLTVGDPAAPAETAANPERG